MMCETRSRQSTLIRALGVVALTVTTALIGNLGTAAAEVSRLVPRTLPEKSIMSSIGDGRDMHTLVLKLRDDSAAIAHDGRLRAGEGGVLAPGEVAAVRQVFEASPEARVEPLFTVPKELLDHLRKLGEHNTGEALADLTQYFVVRIPRQADPLPVLERLLPIGAVENLYASRELRSPADIFPPTPDFLTMPPGQGYRDPAPEGIGVDFAWSRGFRGEGVTVVDLEQNWNLGHEDLDYLGTPGLPRAIIPPAMWFDPALPSPVNIDHGTATLGVLAGGDNGYGVTGLIPGSTVRVMPAFTMVANWLPANSVVVALLNMVPGDVLLIELEDLLGRPFEAFDVEYAVVRQAVALGIHVIEPAGNGGLDLDAFEVVTGTMPLDPSVRDSGAVLVGAGESALPPGEERRDRVASSNFGTRVDSHSWGQNITTLGYGPRSSTLANCTNNSDPFPAALGDPDQTYTYCFNGTSGAGAIVAGGAAVLEQMHQDTFGQPMGTRELRNMLRMGTGANDPIGHQPDLRYYRSFLDRGGLITHRYQADPPIETDRELGRAVASAGDLDGDGIPDQLVGIPGANNQRGRVQILSGATGRALFPEIEGEVDGERFGAAVAGGLDFTGDGIPDFVVGAPRGGSPGLGRATVFDGSTSAPFCPITSIVGVGEAFGSSVAMVPDIDGDSRAEVLVGAPGPEQQTAPGVVGLATLWFSHCSFPLWFTDNEPGARFGFAVASAGDPDGNGVPNVLIGAPNANDIRGRSTGAAYLYNADVTGRSVIFGGTSGGGAPGSFFGGAVAGAGDFDGDGRDDVIVGAPSWAPAGGGVDFGRAYVYNGVGGMIASFGGNLAGGRMGAAVAGVGDFDGDGRDDVAVGRPGRLPVADAGGAGGRVFVFLQPASGTGVQVGQSPPQRVFWRAQDTNFSLLGTSVAAAGDVNGDGLADVLAGEPAGELGGRAYVFSAGPPPDLLTGRPRLVADVGVIEAQDINGDLNGGGVLSPSEVTFTIDAGPEWAGAVYRLVGMVDPSWGPVAQALVDPGDPRYALVGATGTLDALGQSSAPVFGPIPDSILCPNLVGAEFTFVATLTSAGGDTGSLPARVTVINESGMC